MQTITKTVLYLMLLALGTACETIIEPELEAGLELARTRGIRPFN